MYVDRVILMQPYTLVHSTVLSIYLIDSSFNSSSGAYGLLWIHHPISIRCIQSAKFTYSKIQYLSGQIQSTEWVFWWTDWWVRFNTNMPYELYSLPSHIIMVFGLDLVSVYTSRTMTAKISKINRLSVHAIINSLRNATFHACKVWSTWVQSDLSSPLETSSPLLRQ
jgi:hypothetical protein